jgi:hypothetical protein
MNRNQIYITLISLLLSSCSLFVSDEQRSEITRIAIETHLESLYTYYDNNPEEDYQRILFIEGDYIHVSTIKKLKEKLRLPFIDLRTDTTHFQTIYSTAKTNEGKDFSYRDQILDKETGIPVYWIQVDSLKIKSPKRVSLHLYEADIKAVHYQGLEWWFSKKKGSWEADSVYTIWIN